MDPYDVFVPAGLPTITYNPRESTGLEDKIRQYLRAPHSILTISGHTKSGKTVLLKNVLTDEHVWLEGSSISSEKDIWTQLAYAMGIYETEHSSLTHSTADDSGRSAGLNVPVAQTSRSHQERESIERSRDHTRVVPVQASVINKLKRSPIPIVIDDFHFVSGETQERFVRGIKPCLLHGLPVVLLVVPHKANEAVQAEPEMSGRVTNVRVPPWRADELRRIAQLGFSALNVELSEGLMDDFVDQSAGSPLLMQQFCLQVLISSGRRSVVSGITHLSLADRSEFFVQCAEALTVSMDFYRMSRGSLRGSGSRKQMLGSWGEEARDIYGVVMNAITECSPSNAITYRQLRASLARSIRPEDMPRKNQVTRALREIDKIARQSTGSPVLEWDARDEVLYIVDPFFAFFVHWVAPGL